jgi:hypothetical protein
MRLLSRCSSVVCAAATAMLFSANAAAAQGADVIRGRIVGPDSAAVEGASITITSIPGNVARTTTTDKAGRFSIVFPGDEGDYWVSIAAMGFAAKRFEVKRLGDDAILVADARLARAGTRLDPVKVTATRQRVSRDDTLPDIGGAERPTETSNLTADRLGELAALAASIPGVQFIPGMNGAADGYSVLGLGPDQNVASLNGLITGLSSLPRDAAINTSLTTSPYDVSIGGFSGARFNIRSRPGSNFIVRNNSATFDAPQLQWTDAAGRALSQPYSNASLGGLVSGPIKLNSAFYSLSYQLGRRGSDIQSLLNTSPVGLVAAGVSPDSAARLRSILGRLGIPTTAGRIPSQRTSDQGLVFGAIDFNPPSSTTGQSFNLTFNGGWNRQNPVSASVTELPAHGANQTSWNGSIQGRHTNFYDVVLSETSVGISRGRNVADPYLEIPSAVVRVNSALPDGTNDISTIAFGGNTSSTVGSTSTTAQFLNQLSWFSENNKHRLKLSSELRRDWYSQDFTTNTRGSFSYNSLADLENNSPALYSRALGSRLTGASEIVAALALGDYYKPTPNLQLQYGIRVDANRFGNNPTDNPDIDRQFGVPNRNVPNRFAVSPRFGFSWTRGTAPQVAALAGGIRDPRAVIRGGIGMFQGTPAATAIGIAMSNTGLASAVQQLLCVGGAAPIPNWSQYATNTGSVPTTCADGTSGTVFSTTAPNVVLFDPDYRSPRSLRSNLQWSGTVLGGRFSTTAEATYSLNLDQSGNVDLNFKPSEQFVLSGEANRPVFVQPSSIVPTTGAIAASDARVSSKFSRVTELRSDLRSESRQLNFRLAPATLNTSYSWSLAYVYQNVRDQSHGFSSTVGNPFDRTWGRSVFDSRHQIVYTLGYNVADWVRISWYGQFRSGAPYTPLIGGDVNGDGYSNDRAFIPDPAKSDDPALASGLASLLAHGSSSARDCLRRQLNQFAGRNSCEGPWTSLANLSLALNTMKLRLPQRTSVSLQLSNPLAAADLAFHGESKLHGWGQPSAPSSQLFFVRGFDAANRRFRYDVNERFGTTDGTQMWFRAPITLTAIVRVDVGPPRERQSLLQTLDRGRTATGLKATEPILRILYSGGGLLNPLATMLRQADTLKLSQEQADSLAVLNQKYSLRLDSIWTPIAKYLGELPDTYDRSDAYAHYRAGRERSIDALMTYIDDVDGLLTGDQRRRLPTNVAAYLDPRFLHSIRSGTVGFNPLNGTGGPVPGAIGGAIVIGRP